MGLRAECSFSLPSDHSRCLALAASQPVEITINPPPTCTTGIEIPKKESISEPIKYDPSSRKKLFSAMRNDSAFLVLDEYSRVSARNMGAPPSGSTIGNRALRTTNRIFTASATRFLHFVQNNQIRNVMAYSAMH